MSAIALNDVETYTGSRISDDESQGQVAQAIDAETDAQAAVCRVPDDEGDYSYDLMQALVRRVVVAVAKAGVPLGVQFDGATGGGMRITALDAEVRRLEAPYRKLVLG